MMLSKDELIKNFESTQKTLQKNFEQALRLYPIQKDIEKAWLETTFGKSAALYNVFDLILTTIDGTRLKDIEIFCNEFIWSRADIESTDLLRTSKILRLTIKRLDAEAKSKISFFGCSCKIVHKKTYEVPIFTCT